MAKIVDKEFIALMDSCVEGKTGDWDCSTEEGRESFEDMYDLLERIAERYNISTEGAKELPE